jgi:hypothetical protein
MIPAILTNPAIRPVPIAAIVLATVKFRLIPAAVRINISGSMMGDEMQNAYGYDLCFIWKLL